jgi:hypothetical protein
MEQRYYIMKIWQTGNIGSHNIAKADNNPKEGFPTYEIAEQFLLDLYDNKVWEISGVSSFTFTIMKLYFKNIKKIIFTKEMLEDLENFKHEDIQSKEEDLLEVMKRKRKLVVDRWERVKNFNLNENDFNGEWFK